MSDVILEEAVRCFRVEIEALKRTSGLLGDSFVSAIDLILNSHKVVLTGVGKSGIIGQKIAATLSSTGITAIFMHPVDALHGDIGMLQTDDVVILISKSGNTEELVRLVPFLKMHNTKLISIVGNMTSYLANNSDLVLDASVEREACPYNLAPTSSTTATLVIGDALAICLMRKRNFTLNDFSKLHPLGQIGRNITLCVKDVMKNLVDTPVLFPHLTYKEAIVELTRKPTGCLCIIDDDYNLEGILTDGDIRRVLQSSTDVNQLMNTSLTVLMNKEPITINKNAQLVEALALMENREYQISVLPVLDNNKLVGLIRIHDIVGSN